MVTKTKDDAIDYFTAHSTLPAHIAATMKLPEPITQLLHDAILDAIHDMLCEGLSVRIPTVCALIHYIAPDGDLMTGAMRGPYSRAGVRHATQLALLRCAKQHLQSLSADGNLGSQMLQATQLSAENLPELLLNKSWTIFCQVASFTLKQNQPISLGRVGLVYPKASSQKENLVWTFDSVMLLELQRSHIL